MSLSNDPVEVSAALRVGVSLLIRRLKRLTFHSELSMPETMALSLLEREGPSTASALA